MKNLLYPFAIIVLLLAASIYAGQRPYYNWDMFPYMALASGNAHTPFSVTHALVYREAERLLPSGDYLAISRRQPGFRDNANEFQGILRYFRIKPAYLMTVRFGHFVGLDLVTATYLPSIVSFFLIGILVFFWAQQILPLPAASLLTLVTASAPFMIQSARYSSPDMLCAVILFAGLYLATEHAAPIWGLLVSAIAITVRPDAVIYCLLFVLALYLSGKATARTTIVLVTGFMALTLLVIGDPGILREFLFTDTDYASSWTPGDALRHYLVSLKIGLPSFWQSYALVFMILGFVVLFFRHKKDPDRRDLWSWLIIMAMAAMVVRYLLHPVIEDRFLVASYLLIIMGSCKTWKAVLQTRTLHTLP